LSNQFKNEIPISYFNVDSILKGDEGLIWSFILKLKEICPTPQSKERIIYLEDIELPYSFEEIDQLE